MEQQSSRVPKTAHERLMPTPAQEHAVEIVVGRCRDRYNAALDERKTAWERRGVSSKYYPQLGATRRNCPS
jgi:hypothetical protein